MKNTKELSIKAQKLLAAAGASPVEMELFRILTIDLQGKPIQSSDLKKKYDRSDSTIKLHLTNMIAKGLIIRQSRYIYQVQKVTDIKKPRKKVK